MKNSRSLRRSLLVVVVIPTVSITIILIAVVLIGARLIQSEVEQRQGIMIDAIARLGEDYIMETKPLMHSLVDNMIGMPLDRKAEILKQLLDHYSRFSAFYLLDENGVVLVEDSDSATLLGIDLSTEVSGEKSFQVGREQHEMYISDPFISRTTEQVAITLAVPVFNAGRFNGMLVGELSLENLQEAIAQLDVGEDATTYIVDYHGTLVAHPNQVWVQERRNFGNIPLVKQGLSDGFAFDLFYDEIQDQWLIGSAAPMVEKWLVVSTLPAVIAARPLIILMIASGIGVLLSTILFLWGLRYSVRKITNPIKALVCTADAVSKGRYHNFSSERGVEGEYREIISLNRSLSSMVLAIERRRAELIKTNQALSDELRMRKKAEQTLKESEEKYRLLVENAHEAIMVVQDGIIKYSNPMTLEITGYSQKELRAKAFIELIHPDDHEVMQKHPGKKLRGESLIEANSYRIIDKSGRTKWVEYNTIPVLWEEVPAALIFLSDISERVHADERTRRHFERLNALHTIDNAITASRNLNEVLDVIVEQVMSRLNVDAADVLLYEAPTLTLHYMCGRGFRANARDDHELIAEKSHAGSVVLRRQMVHIPDITENSSGNNHIPQFLKDESFVTYFGIPLIAKGQLMGVLETYHRCMFDPSLEWLGFLQTLAGQAAIAIDNAKLFEDLQSSNLELKMAYDTTLEGWAKALELRDNETKGHSQRVTDLTVKLARGLGMSGNELVHLRRGALLHDIGKMGIPDSILHKPGPLTDAEWEIMRQHPVWAHNLLSQISYLSPALDIPYCHHEKWDGSGYPHGLKGEQIPIAARIFAVVDVWDALLSDRPYRTAWSREKALTYLHEQSGVHFDPQVVEAFNSTRKK